MQNFDNYKFRCSSVGKLFYESTGKSNLQKFEDAKTVLEQLQAECDAIPDEKKQMKLSQNKAAKVEKLAAEFFFLEQNKDVETLSQTAKSYLITIFIEEFYGRKYPTYNKYFEKGTLQEEDAITLLSEVETELPFLEKNKQFYSNNFICGTPDLVLDDLVVDLKVAFGLNTLLAKDDDICKEYFYQLQSYGLLTGITNLQISYCLVDTPKYIIEAEIQREMRKNPFRLVPNIEKEMYHLHTFSDIDPKNKVKSYQFELLPDFEMKLQRKVIAAREFLNELAEKHK